MHFPLGIQVWLVCKSNQKTNCIGRYLVSYTFNVSKSSTYAYCNFHITDKLINTYIKTDVVFVFERDNILELPQVWIALLNTYMYDINASFSSGVGRIKLNFHDSNIQSGPFHISHSSSLSY